MVVESSLRCSKIDGLKGHQEHYADGSGLKMPGLTSLNNGGEETGDPKDKTITRVLPFSNDLVQINWAIDIANRAYVDTAQLKLKQFNDAVKDKFIPGRRIRLHEMPQQPLPCMGFPICLESLKPEVPEVPEVPEEAGGTGGAGEAGSSAAPAAPTAQPAAPAAQTAPAAQPAAPTAPPPTTATLAVSYLVPLRKLLQICWST
jgi:hypothetical protein